MSEWAIASGVVFSGLTLMVAYWLGYRTGIKAERLSGEAEFSAALLKYQGKAEKIRNRYETLLHHSVSDTLGAHELGRLLSAWQAEDNTTPGKANP